LDDIARSPQISFSSRLPHAVPLTDAVSLQSNVVTFNPHDPVFVEFLHRDRMQTEAEDPIPFQPKNIIFLLTNHKNGSLNLWQLGTDEKSNFSVVLSMTLMKRMCGHRYDNNGGYIAEIT
jgi:hypothetical protein